MYSPAIRTVSSLKSSRANILGIWSSHKTSPSSKKRNPLRNRSTSIKMRLNVPSQSVLCWHVTCWPCQWMTLTWWRSNSAMSTLNSSKMRRKHCRSIWITRRRKSRSERSKRPSRRVISTPNFPPWFWAIFRSLCMKMWIHQNPGRNWRTGYGPPLRGALGCKGWPRLKYGTLIPLLQRLWNKAGPSGIHLLGRQL